MLPLIADWDLYIRVGQPEQRGQVESRLLVELSDQAAEQDGVGNPQFGRAVPELRWDSLSDFLYEPGQRLDLFAISVQQFPEQVVFTEQRVDTWELADAILFEQQGLTAPG